MGKLRKRPDGKGWIYDAGMIDGKRVRLTKPTKEAAREAGIEFQAKVRYRGERLAVLDPVEVAGLVRESERLAAVGVTLKEAVDFYFLHSRPPSGNLPIPELLNRWLAERGAKRSGKHSKNVRNCLIAMIEDLDLAARPASGLSAGEIEAYLRRPEWSAETQRAYLRNLSAVFGWGVERGFLRVNPCAKVVCEEPGPRAPVTFLTPAQCRGLLGETARLDPDLLPFLVLAMFAGVRVAELDRSDRGAVDLVAGEMAVEAKNTSRARGRDRRIVELSGNALAWLRAAEAAGFLAPGPFCPFNFRKRWDACKAGVSPWPGNVLRHTFATYHYAMHRNEAALQVLLGHYSSEMLHNHYRGLARRSDAEEFWSILP